MTIHPKVGVVGVTQCLKYFEKAGGALSQGRDNFSKVGVSRCRRHRASTPKASTARRQRRRDGGEWGGGIPFPSRLGSLGSVVSSPSGVRGGAPAEIEFCAI